MTALREAAIKALEAMDYLHRTGDTQVFDLCHRETTEALRAALAEPVLNPAPGYCKHCKQYTIEEPLPAEPVQEPVAWLSTDCIGERYLCFSLPLDNDQVLPLYTAPPQRKPLTEEEIYSLFRTAGSPVLFARAIERAHGITP